MSARRRGGKRSVSAAVSAIMADRDIEEQLRAMDASSPRVAAAPLSDAEAHGANPNAIEPKSLWTAGRASAASVLHIICLTVCRSIVAAGFRDSGFRFRV